MPKALSDDEVDQLMAATPLEPMPEGFLSDDEVDRMMKAPSMGDTVLRGLAQGGSGAFADELTGGAGYVAGKLGLVPDMGYDYYRDYARSGDKAAEAANPKAYMGSQVGGVALTAALPGMQALGAGMLPAALAGGARAAGTAAVSSGIQGAAQAAGATENSLLSKEGALDVAKGAGWGAGGGLAGYGAGKAIAKGSELVDDAANWLGKKFKGSAEKLAEKATGATGRQAEKYAEGTGRELLDRGIIKFGDSPEGIAERAAAMQSESGRKIGEALKGLDDKGVTASVDKVVDVIQGQIDELSATPGNEKIIRQLQAEIENLVERGQSKLPVSAGEIAKRNYQGQVNYASPEAEKKAAARMASAFRQEVEDAASAADPAVAQKFLEDKKLFGVLAPVREAAEKRASQLKQSPFGGFGDIAAEAAGQVATGSPLGLAAAGRRIFAPRAASSLAVGADRLGDVLKKAPQMLGKFSAPLQAAAQRGTQAMAATHFILQQTQPEYQDLMKQLEESDGQE